MATKTKKPKTLSWTTAAYKAGNTNAYLEQTEFVSCIEAMKNEFDEARTSGEGHQGGDDNPLLAASSTLQYKSVGLALESLATAKTAIKKTLTKADTNFYTELKEHLKWALEAGLDMQGDLIEDESAHFIDDALGFLDRILEEDRKSLVLYAAQYLELKALVADLEAAPNPGKALLAIDDRKIWRFSAVIDEASGTKSKKLIGEIEDLHERLSRLLGLAEAIEPGHDVASAMVGGLLHSCRDVCGG